MLLLPNLEVSQDNSHLVPYLAGFFDGEGCVRIRSQYKTVKGRSPRFTLRAFAVQRAEYAEPLWLCQKVFGGDVWNAGTKKQPRWKPTLAWVIQGKPAFNALQLMLPYLRVKRAAALAGVAFAQSQDIWHACRKHGERQAPFEAEISQQFKDLFTNFINKRGVTLPTANVMVQ